jgi:hypothetical protein
MWTSLQRTIISSKNWLPAIAAARSICTGDSRPKCRLFRPATRVFRPIISSRQSRSAADAVAENKNLTCHHSNGEHKSSDDYDGTEMLL